MRVANQFQFESKTLTVYVDSSLVFNIPYQLFTYKVMNDR